jgi:hypothetical protein
MVLVSSLFTTRVLRRFSIGVVIGVCGWLLAVGFVVWHARAMDGYLTRATATRFTEVPVATPLTRIPQAIAPDGQVWIRHALALAENGAWRLRTTDQDNAPAGREIYWNSGWALWLEACGQLRRMCTGEPLPAAVEAASLWAQLPVFLLVLTLATVWMGLRWGGWAAALTAVALAGHRGFYEGFYPAYCDHHGLINAAVVGLVLGAVFAGAGWWQRRSSAGVSPLPGSEAEVMRAATFSAVAGALGLWVSAASLVVPIALTGLSVLIAALCCGRAQAGNNAPVCVPLAWRRWGQVGAWVSLGLYLLENAPDRLGIRMEANHPLYSLAWYAGGELIAVLLIWRNELRSAAWWGPRLIGWGTLVLAAPALVWAKGSAVFIPLDPFMLRIHSSIDEFKGLLPAAAQSGWSLYADTVFISAVAVVLLIVWWVRKPPLAQRIVVTLVASVALTMTVQGWFQRRWLLPASGPQIILIIVLLVTLVVPLHRLWRAVILMAVGALLFFPGPWLLATDLLKMKRLNDFFAGEAMQLLYRDIAGALRKAGADERSVVLASANASVGVGYYGRLRTVGTLYWENHAGLKTAAEVFGARDEAEAAARIRAAGITHVAMVSSYDFLAEYAYANDGVWLSPQAGRERFGSRLLYQHRVPVWLRPVRYQVPVLLSGLRSQVALFAVDFTSAPAIAHERIGRYQLGLGARDLAEASFLASLASDASRPGAWLCQGEILLARGRVSEAVNFIQAGLQRTPTEQRGRLLHDAVVLLARQGAAGQAEADRLLALLMQ